MTICDYDYPDGSIQNIVPKVPTVICDGAEGREDDGSVSSRRLNGQDGGNVIVRLTSDVSKQVFNITINGECQSIPFTDTHTMFNISANGGKGGDRKNHVGCYRGLKGGKGGRGGKVTFKVTKKEDTDLLMLFNPPSINGGEGGRGEGGGNFGVDGYPGKLEIQVPGRWGVRKYKEPYRLVVSGICLINESESGVYEPGGSVNCIIKVRNVGGMPTPKHQRITLQFVENSWVAPVYTDSQVLVLPGGIKAGDEYTVSYPLKAYIKYPEKISVGRVFLKDVPLKLSAVMERVNRSFVSIDNQNLGTVRVEYPIQLTDLAGLHVARVGSEIPILVLLKNISNKALGGCGFFDRRVYVKVEVISDQIFSYRDITLRDREGNVYSGSHGMTLPVEKVEGGDSAVITSTIQFNPCCEARLNNEIKLMVTLYLQKIGSRTLSGGIPIQCQSITIGLSECYQPPSLENKSEVLLVVCANVSMTVIRFWKEMLISLGYTGVSIWHTELYGGVVLKEKLNAGSSLKEDFCGGAMVFLVGSDYLTSWSLTDVYHSAIEANIKIYIVSTDGRLLLPASHPYIPTKGVLHENCKSLISAVIKQSDQLVMNEYQYVEYKKVVDNEYVPDVYQLKSKALSINKWLRKKLPHRSYFCAYEFNPVIEGNVCNFGKIFIYSSLECSDGVIVAYSPKKPIPQDIVHKYQMIKFLSFKRKLKLINTINDRGVQSLLIAAILSDLAEEQKALRLNFDSNAFTIDHLQKLKYLCEYGSEEDACVMITILYHMKYISVVLRCTSREPFACARQVSVCSEELINNALKPLKITLGRRKSEKIKESIKDANRYVNNASKMLIGYCNPVGYNRKSVWYDQWNQLNKRVMSKDRFDRLVKDEDITINERAEFGNNEDRDRMIRDGEKWLLNE